MDGPDYRAFISAKDDSVSTLHWLAVLFALLLPGVNLFLLLSWSFSRSAPRSKRTFARGLLLFVALLGTGLFFAWRIDGVHEFVKGPIVDRFVEVAKVTAVEYQSEAPRFRTFTHMDGRTMEAKVEGFSGSKVVIRREDGAVYEADFNRFSHADRDYLIETRSRLERKE